MNPIPSGRLITTATGRDLVLTRTFHAPIDDVWASITEPERTARWFCSWSGDAAPGQTITFRLVMEQGQPDGQMTIDACEPPHHLAVSAADDYGTWRLEARLTERDGITQLDFIHHLDDGADVGEVGPGWEYYLDLLVASRNDEVQTPTFDHYFPAQQQYYNTLVG